MSTYMSSDGTQRSTETMATSHVKNAIAKIKKNREVGIVDNEYTQGNLEALEAELLNRTPAQG